MKPPKMATQEKVVNPYIHSGRVNWKEFACGWGAAFINITVTYPVNKLIFRQMLHGVKVSNAYEQLHTEGIRYLYRGILPPLFQKSFSLAIMFGVYEEVRRPLIEKGTNKYLSKAAAAMASGTVECVLVPFERIQTLLQDSAYHYKFRNMFHAFREIGVRYGFREYYRGLVPILLRNGPSNVFFFIIRDELQSRMSTSDSFVQRTFHQFLCGAFIGVFLSSLFFPINVAKVSIQSRLGGEFQDFFKVLGRIYTERGRKLRYMYHGVHTNCARAFISWGVVNAAYEHIKKILY